jgi:hypothetical protein
LNQLRATDEALSSPVSQGDESLEQLPDREETKPIEVSLSGVALALAAGCAWVRGQRCKRRKDRSGLILV